MFVNRLVGNPRSHLEKPGVFKGAEKKHPYLSLTLPPDTQDKGSPVVSFRTRGQWPVLSNLTYEGKPSVHL